MCLCDLQFVNRAGYTLKKCWGFLTEFWVKYRQPAIVLHFWITFFNPVFQFVHI